MDTETSIQAEPEPVRRRTRNGSPLSCVRAGLGLHQAEVAKRLFLSQAKLSDRETGIVPFSAAEARDYAAALGLSLRNLRARVRALGGQFPPALQPEAIERRKKAIRSREAGKAEK